jgi:hypothetical protein
MASLFDSRAPFGSFYGNFSTEEEDRIKAERANQILADQNFQTTQSAFEEGYGTGGFPTFPQDNYNLPNVDIQAQAQQMYNQNIMSDLEFQKKLDEERRKTQLMEIFSAMATGRAPKIVPYSTMPKSAQSSASADDTELGMAWKIFRENPPSNTREMDQFIKKYGIGPSTADFLRKQLPMYDEGEMIPLRKWNSESNKMEIIYRPKNSDISKELGAGFTMTDSDAKAQQAAAILDNAKQTVGLARTQYLSGKLNTNKDLKLFFETNNITDPSLISTIQGLYPDLVNENDLVPIVENGKTRYVPKNEEASALMAGAIRPDQIDSAINSIANSSMDVIFASESIPTKNEVSSAVFRALEGQPYDAEKVQKQIDARYGQAERTAMTKADILQYGLNEASSLSDVAAKFNKPEQAEALAQALTDLKDLRPNIIFDPTKIPAVMFDKNTANQININSEQDYIDALRNGYQEERPNIGVYNQRDKSVKSLPDEPANTEIAQFVMKSGDDIIRERRYTTQGAVKLADSYKVRAQEKITKNQEFKQNYADVINNLAQKSATTDYNAIRAMEKLYDPKGVVRGSDIDNLFRSLGGGFQAAFEKMLARVTTGRSTVLTQYERDMLAYAADAAYRLRVSQIKNEFTADKRTYEHTSIKPWDSEFRAKDWDYNSDVYRLDDLSKEYAAPSYPGTSEDIFEYYKNNVAVEDMSSLTNPNAYSNATSGYSSGLEEENNLQLLDTPRRKSKAANF